MRKISKISQVVALVAPFSALLSGVSQSADDANIFNRSSEREHFLDSADVKMASPDQLVLVVRRYDNFDRTESKLFMKKSDLDFALDAYNKVTRGRRTEDQFHAYAWIDVYFPDTSSEGGGAGNFEDELIKLSRTALSYNAFNEWNLFTGVLMPSRPRATQISFKVVAREYEEQNSGAWRFFMSCNATVSPDNEYLTICGNVKYQRPPVRANFLRGLAERRDLQ